MIYYLCDQTLPIYLLIAYAKNERDDLSPDQKKILRRLVEDIVVGRRS